MNRTKANIALHDLLTTGPLKSREVLAVMAAQNFTPKQVRRAREQLGLDVARAGSGATMHSTWQLPEPTNSNIPIAAPTGTNRFAKEPQRPKAHSCPGSDRESAALSRGSQPARELEPISTRARASGLSTRPAAVVTTAALGRVLDALKRTADEHRRHQTRIDAFVARGMNVGSAAEVADALVQADRDGRPAMGSCAQCQNLQRGLCPVTPRPPVDIHECWFRRRDTP